MKKVKFNVTSTVHMIPDEVYPQLQSKIRDMRINDFKGYKERMEAGSEFELKNVNIDDVIEIPDWYYDLHKEDLVEISVSIPNYRDDADRPQPFDMADAMKHYPDLKNTDTMKKVKRFELVVAKK